MQADEAAPRRDTAANLVDLASFIGTLAAIGLMIGGFLALDLFLARVDRRESSSHAASEYQTGVDLLGRRDPRAAADHFEAALTIDRDNVNYALALGEAQRRAGKSSDAEATLRTLLERAENDGAVNLAMARVLAEEGRNPEAKAYFHRAIYGRWGSDSLARRAEARFALIRLLAAHGGGSDLLAELLPLEDVPADSLTLRKRLGHWFLLAGSPSRAANMYREVIRRDPHDAEGFAGMGESALAQANFRTARADFVRAIDLSPSDSSLAARLSMTDSLLATDPLARGIGAQTRIERARALINRMLTALEPCIAANPRPIADSARSGILGSLKHAPGDEADADRLTTTAADLWAAYAPRCASVKSDSLLTLLAARLAQ